MAENQNKEHSSSKQLLLDAISVLDNNAEMKRHLQAVLTYLDSTDGADAKVAIDKKFNAHKYPEKDMTFFQMVNYKTGQPLLHLSDGAYRLFGTLCMHMSQSDGCVLTTHNSLSKILNVSKKSISRYMEELMNTRLIRVLEPANTELRKSGTLYRINAEYAWAGKTPNKKQSLRNTVETVSAVESCVLTTVRETVTYDNGDEKTVDCPIRYNILLPFEAAE